MSRKHRASSQATTEVEVPLTRKENAKYGIIWTIVAVLALWALFAVTAPPSNAAPPNNLPGTSIQQNPCADPRKTITKDGVIHSCGPIKLNNNGRALVRCLGAAGLGTLRGGGYYGAGVAGAGCAFAHIYRDR